MCIDGNRPQYFKCVYRLFLKVYGILKKDYYPSFVVSETYTRELMPELVDPDVDLSQENTTTGEDKTKIKATGSTN